LTEIPRKRVGDDARDDIRGAARGKSNDVAHGPDWKVIFRRSNRWRQDGETVATTT
jgi:hypothetical protein